MPDERAGIRLSGCADRLVVQVQIRLHPMNFVEIASVTVVAVARVVKAV